LARVAIARAVAAIAGVEMEAGTWPQLLPAMIQTCVSSNVQQRETGIYIIYAVLEAVVEGFQSLYNDLFQLFERLLQDPESVEVRITTVKYVYTLS
jgi:importin-4